ncbi:MULTISPECIES: hypothetical protein [Brochothrix]|uniref:Uncharacterized protein n=1 Tax=Brochothrix thermosphacta TaxID=2756 RepID=A0A2X0S0R9_BROTH|nr:MULTISPECIES: hypothetical protein [Brochothrix]SLM90685.1 hypothetical protein FM106_02245 [Brachybacterium faecium]MBR5526339.1 hypothetical protein [Brochothrix sp.]MDO7863148.1 hypothetical protein [Brochothrix thermosphacta]WKK70173.1 hypothetical protein Q0G00_06245 [Brochothrix thermosphacta]SOC29646.1 hypothetical protein BTH160X_50344 [Brochothrix thermosphacta]
MTKKRVRNIFFTLIILGLLIFQKQIGYTLSLVLAGIIIAYYIAEGIIRTRGSKHDQPK